MTIAYDDWAKLDVRVGTIRAAERVEGTDKLIKCTVDFGAELGERTIVSGIALWREPDALIGKQCPYIVNLEPRIIRGVESRGMLLAASDENGIALLHPDAPLGPGARVK
ncbi:methionine--tRNA ligase [Candidatus Kaiserbacteria bacterium CG10_big_fil_rev_8_21_14_0_10_59_10]|uniref:Methionine--tRNA ligase n=1 Tax=Candidatus Kaiserbacteria bacterium CG10_big_fil_rev_8_21_14_0_10_59_10 TaxID=1974612 RepID=A0A2H0U7W4_9BACT|nr:MAG: methionine--tRNA ligase [Candidatus Kaiserbacteria bacterium CG10_big_fil_rev_8_21_14_0_10_59_10]